MVSQSAAWALTPLHLLQGPTASYERVAEAHPNQFLLRWEWYEQIGAFAPLALLAWFRHLARAQRRPRLELVLSALLVYAAVYLVAGIAFSLPQQLLVLARLQPMRSLFLEYILLFLVMGAFLSEYVLGAKLWRWLLFFVPLCSVMYWAQLRQFPASAHLEWPWARPRNGWVQAFEWVRTNTPKDAVFALDPYFLHFDGEDENGFRGIAYRDRLADATKDSGVAEMFPQAGDRWLAEVQAQNGLGRFDAAQFRNLHQKFGASWVVLKQPSNPPLACPYVNSAARVCRLP